MQRRIKAFLTLSLMVLSMTAYGFRASTDSLRIEVLLTPSMVNEINPGCALAGSVEITPDNLILLSSSDRFYLLGWGGIIPMGEEVIGSIGAFAYTSDSLLMTVRNNELCAFGQDGNLNRLYTLPSGQMGISQGKFVMYIYDRNPYSTKHSLFVIAHGAQYSKLFDVPAPIYSVAEMGDQVIFTNDNSIYQFDVKTRSMKALASLPADKVIKSIASDPLSGKIYFSTDDMVFALKDKEISVVTDKFGGILKYFRGLIVFNPEKKFLVHISGLERAIDIRTTEPVNTTGTESAKDSASGQEQAPATVGPPLINILTNQSVIDMKKAGLSDNLIIALINRNRVDFNLDVDSVIDLSNNNISPTVIKAMRLALKNQDQEKEKTDKNN
ncbi:MAG TPA: hypothetical protein PKH02_02340 [Bacteroidales bacterium]|nr:hypothetical protein [Bacteroidales bacterium]HPT11451.1 hypothetical protein [Bacteroidales bacterium]